MTYTQAMKKVKIARETGRAWIDKDSVIYYDSDRREYSLEVRDGLHWNTVTVTYKPEKIAELLVD